MWLDTTLITLVLSVQFAALLILIAWVGEIHTRVKRLDRERLLEEPEEEVRDAAE